MASQIEFCSTSGSGVKPSKPPVCHKVELARPAEAFPASHRKETVDKKNKKPTEAHFPVEPALVQPQEQAPLIPGTPTPKPRPGYSGRTVFSISDIEKKAGVAHVNEKGPAMVSLPSSTRIPEDVALALVRYSAATGMSYAVIATNALKLHIPREYFEIAAAPAADSQTGGA